MRFLLVALGVSCCTATAAAQQPASPAPVPSATPAAAAASPAPGSPGAIAQQRIDQIFTVPADASWFSAVFLAQVSPQQIDTIVAQLKSSLGAYHGATRQSPGVFIARFDKGTEEVDIHLDTANKIDGLFFKPPVMTAPH